QQEAAIRLTREYGDRLARHLKEQCVHDSSTFSPSTVFRLPGSPTDEGSFVISFAPSMRHGFDRNVHCVFSLVVKNADPVIVELAAATGLSSGAFDSVSKAPLHPLYDGPYETMTG